MNRHEQVQQPVSTKIADSVKGREWQPVPQDGERGGADTEKNNAHQSPLKLWSQWWRADLLCEVVVVRLECWGVAVRRDRGWCAGSMACIALSGVDEAFAVAHVAILLRLRHQISEDARDVVGEPCGASRATCHQ